MVIKHVAWKKWNIPFKCGFHFRTSNKKTGCREKKFTNPCYAELKLYTFPEKFPKIIPIHVSLCYFEFERRGKLVQKLVTVLDKCVNDLEMMRKKMQNEMNSVLSKGIVGFVTLMAMNCLLLLPINQNQKLIENLGVWTWKGFTKMLNLA